ncbi:hypothetical protein CF326_g4056 [Tilletia indica]|nr:hypothetical protein CF326_g4056 [Tilletia indica]
MPSEADLFSNSTVVQLRNYLIARCPRKGASKMARPALVQSMLDYLVSEEVTFLERIARLPITDIASPLQFLPIVHRQMLDKHGAFFTEYVRSQHRQDHPSLAPMFARTFAEREKDNEDPLTDPQLETNKWPQPIPAEVTTACMQDFIDNTNIAVSDTCAVCGRRTFTQDTFSSGTHLKCRRFASNELELDILTVTDPHLLARPRHHFTYGIPALDDLALHKEGIHVQGDSAELDVCGECHSALTSTPPKLPALALANDNVRGYLPPHLQDCTWLEERLCAKYLASAYIVKLYDLTAPGAPEERARVMKGHACSFPLNTVSTAAKLPWTVENDSALISCIVIGPRKPRTQDLRNVFTVRRQKVKDLLSFLNEHCKGYPELAIDEDALNVLPDNDIPEFLMRHVVYEERQDVPSIFAKETAGLDLHPAVLDDADNGDQEPRTFLEHHGLLDINGMSVPAHSRSASALATATGTERPDLVIRHGSKFVEDYNNPGLFPGMYPLLFPWGTGGFESKRDTPLSFSRQAKYLLDITESTFRRHWSFIFVVANIKQRRAIHLGSRLMCKSGDFERFSTLLRRLDPAIIRRVSEHVARGGSLNTISAEERQIFAILKKCEIVSANVPGSKAIMNRARAEIRSYIGQYGIFQLFLTLNPGPAHSPVFQVFFGDRSIKLQGRDPPMPSMRERATRVADDPVAASDYFHFHINAVFRFLLGWDIRRKASTETGGLFGRLSAYYLVKEHSMRGQLHCHCLIWLQGGLNPSVLRARMQTDEEFQDRYLRFFDELLSHGYPATSDFGQEEPQPTQRKPRQERPPAPTDASYAKDFEDDHRLLAHEVQKHRCTFTCFKGGREACRFLFPHDVVSKSSFDADTNSITLRVQHPLINWHNPTLLVATRHNHDLKAVQSGKSGSAAASYITSYTTKSEETPANQISMINTVYDRMAALGAEPTDARSLLSRCVMQFGRERQVHAQQAATYVRDLGDVQRSHETTPMLSGPLTAMVHRLYGPIRQEMLPIPLGGDSTPSSAPPPPDATAPTQPDASDSHIQDGDGCDEDEEGAASTGFMPLNHRGTVHQIEDYFHRAEALDMLNFYDFVQHVRLVKSPKNRNASHHSLPQSHQNWKTHVHRYAPLKSHGIPRYLAASFPRRDGTAGHGDSYCAAMMAHFIPFNTVNPLKQQNQTWEQAFAQARFTGDTTRVMDNWAALSECEDARDADQLQRRRREAGMCSRGETHVSVDAPGAADSNIDVDMELLQAQGTQQSPETSIFCSVLDQGGWFDGGTAMAADINDDGSIDLAHQNKRLWTKEQGILEAKAKADLAVPTASSGVLADQLMFDDNVEETSTMTAPSLLENGPGPSTQRLHWQDRHPHELLQALVVERDLTPSQTLAFTIAGKRFFEHMHGVETEPLRLLMHGEAGTGKTVVVRLLRELMDRFGKGNEIRFMAPTGKAASAIGGTTQHAAFGLDVHRRGLTTEELQLASRENHSQRLSFLQGSFAHVTWVFFDEVSMTSCEVFGDIDQALRTAMQRPSDPFGGINVLFAGDLCQLPPVASAPLYTKASRTSQPADIRTKVELGRISWLFVTEVVEFTEQMRMKDPEMAAALSRLRTRDCIDGDTELFNTSLLQSTATSIKGRRDLIVLAATNRTVRVLNERKAAAQASAVGNHLVVSHSIDDTKTPMTMATRTALLGYNGRGETKVGIGRLPLFVGMPVIYRGPNKSVALGITNGSFGTIVGWQLQEDHLGYTTPVVAIVRFDVNATWKLSGLQPGCLPIFPTSSSFTFALGSSAGMIRRVSRRQLPLQPGFAMTVHSAQGITCKNGVVVDLRNGGFPAYVAASRATRREDIFLVAPVTTTQLNSPPLPRTLRDELKRLQHLATKTKDRHINDDWRLPSPRPDKLRRVA